MAMAMFSSPSSHLPTLPPLSSAKTHLTQNSYLSLRPKRPLISVSTRATDDGSGEVAFADTVEDQKVELKASESPVADSEQKLAADNGALWSNGSAAAAEEVGGKFRDPRWVGGTWDLKQFHKNGKTDWDSVIDAEVRRRKWLEDNPESTSNEDPIVFDTSIIPWWAWMKRFHLPEAERLNGRAAMIGFFMAYLVDSLTGLGLVDQTGNFFCKTLLFVAVAGVLLIRKNEDIENLKRLLDETTFYDKQWQATWQEDETPSSPKKD